ncbi:MAG: hypothetical protein PUP92_37470, partial [Rhizonema sp. PD38]|nr:hypothetical protein [Rhizonema sp. PD38]
HRGVELVQIYPDVGNFVQTFRSGKSSRAMYKVVWQVTCILYLRKINSTWITIVGIFHRNK